MLDGRVVGRLNEARIDALVAEAPCDDDADFHLA